MNKTFSLKKEDAIEPLFEGNPNALRLEKKGRKSGCQNLVQCKSMLHFHDRHIRARSMAGFWKKISLSFVSSPRSRFKDLFFELKEEGQYCAEAKALSSNFQFLYNVAMSSEQKYVASFSSSSSSFA